MDKLQKVLEECLNENLVQIVFSGARYKEGIQKIKIRPIEQKGRVLFQASKQKGKQEIHQNYEKEEMIQRAGRYLKEDFKQMQMVTTKEHISVLSGKKGNVTIKRKQRREEGQAVNLSHNRKKQYILKEGVPVPFLIDLGVMTPEGKVIKARYDKFRQINRFLEFIEDIRPKLDGKREVTQSWISGAESSILTFAMYYSISRCKEGWISRVIGLT